MVESESSKIPELSTIRNGGMTMEWSNWQDWRELLGEKYSPKHEKQVIAYLDEEFSFPEPKKKVTKADRIPRSLAREDAKLLAWYTIAYNAVKRSIPVKDQEDIIQECLVSYIAKEVKEEYLLYLIAKEKVVQYYRRGRIEDRVYRNILLTKGYWVRKDKQGENMEWRSKYEEGEYEDVEFLVSPEDLEDIPDDMDRIDIVIDRVFFQSFPKRIKDALKKKELGEKLTASDYKALSRFAKKFSAYALA